MDRGGVLEAASLELAPAAQIDRGMQSAFDPGRELGLQVLQIAALPGQVVVPEDDAPLVPGGSSGDRPGGCGVERERAKVVDDEEVGATDRVDDRLLVRCCGGVDRQRGQHDVVRLPVVFDRARDASGREPELMQRPLPLARFDRDAVVTAKAVRDRHGLPSHASSRVGELRDVHVCEAAVGRVEHRTRHRIRFLLRTHDCRS